MKRLSFLLIAGAFVALVLGATVTRGLTPAQEKVDTAYALVSAKGTILEKKVANLKVRRAQRGVYCLTTTFPVDDVIVPVSTAVDLKPKRGWSPSQFATTAVWRVNPTKACTGRAVMHTGADTDILEVDTYRCGPHSCLPTDSPFMVNPTG